MTGLGLEQEEKRRLGAQGGESLGLEALWETGDCLSIETGKFGVEADKVGRSQGQLWVEILNQSATLVLRVS